MKRRTKRVSPRDRNSHRAVYRQSEYESPEWRAKREEIFKRDNYTCQWKGCDHTSTELHCHHTKYFRGHIADTPEQYLITVCVVCHSRIHNRNLSRNLRKTKPKS